eukprot:m.328330 g.328330  ORF g.328330 m.328330 type:complete len:62 (-) comp27688_c0_seq2:6788-6973(-)
MSDSVECLKGSLSRRSPSTVARLDSWIKVPAASWVVLHAFHGTATSSPPAHELKVQQDAAV